MDLSLPFRALMIRFLSSFRFALVLIALSAVFVIAGTFLEAKDGSHKLAEKLVYQNPLFQILLGGYFVNILFSALSRFPFKKRHIPFLITHLGLLMMISGVFIKTRFGVQGHVQLIEGTVTDDLIYPDIPALYIERKFPFTTKSIPIDQLNLISFYPHAAEQFTFWENSAPENVQIAKTDTSTILHAVDIWGDQHQIAFSHDRLKEWIAYDKGFGGYAVQAKIPYYSAEDQKASVSLLENELKKASSLAKPLELMKDACRQSLINFPKSAISYLKEWNEAGTWLYDTPYIAPINWENHPDKNALYWISELFSEDNFIENLEKKKWPLIDHLKAHPENQKEAWMMQLYSVQKDLPPPEKITPFQSARMLSAYLRMFSIHYRNIPKPPIEQFITIESPLSHNIIPRQLPVKIEDATPGLTISFEGEPVSLIYDPHKTSLKWPVKSANHLLRFQPHREKLPYYIRLHQALDIKQPDSEQTASYECTISLQDKKTGAIIPCNLSMNHVFETDDGFRFYLAGMGVIDSYNVRSVQLVVNRDPAKMILTYPGALLIALGTLLLFFKKQTR